MYFLTSIQYNIIEEYSTMSDKKYIQNGILIGILILSVALRFYKLGEIPNGFSWDEAAQGYNAFSIGTTTRDEFGRFLPRDYLESFGDFKPVLYTYLAILPVKIWGLNEYSTRFPSAFFGTLTVLLTYFLVKEIFYKQKNKSAFALLTTFVMAISPWHIQMSRAAFEANIGLFLVVLGVYLFLKGINQKKEYLILSAIPLAAIFYTFNSTRAFIPFFIGVLVLLNLKRWKEFWKVGLLFIFVFQLLLVEITPHLISPQAKLRFQEVNIFSDSKPIEISNARIAVDQNIWWSKILHNRRWLYTTEFLRHYFDNLNLRFLFLNGDGNPKFSIQDVGQLYIVDLPFFILGLLFLLKKYPDESKLIFSWLLIGIIPAATARETPHALRILQTLPMWQIMVAVGFYETYLYFHSNKLKRGFIIITLFLLSGNIIYYLHNYYTHYTKEFAGEWQYGYKEAIQYISSVYPNYDRITFTDALGRPYIYFLFYDQYPSTLFRQTAKIERDAFGFVKIKSYDKYEFGGTEILQKNNGKKTLSVVTIGNIPNGKEIKKTIFLPNGKPILVIYEN